MKTQNRFRFDGDKVTLPDGFTLTFTSDYDTDSGAPWEREEGHGPVTDWVHREKKSGEILLCSDRIAKRFYDFAGAMAIAKRDGWGLSDDALAALTRKLGHAPTKGQLAEAAVLADFHYLEGWANDRWHYVGVIVTLRNPEGEEVETESLWGVEDSGDYYQGVAEELAEELESRHSLDVAEDFDAACRN